jgi:hypothetical protein
MVLAGGTHTAGSFMSFQMPAMPTSVNILCCRPHHARVAGRVKSGNTLLPGLFGALIGQTGPSNSVPSGFLTKWSPATPSSKIR